MLSKKEFKKEDLLSALQELDCSRNCPCCEYFSPDDIQKCQDPTPYAVDLLEEFIQDVFNPQPYKFEDLKAVCIYMTYKKNEIIYLFKPLNWDPTKGLRYSYGKIDHAAYGFYMDFEENRFYPVQMANARCE